MSPRGEGVWGALANPVRRQVLDRLRTGPQTTGALAAGFPELSRYAVMQHLDVLEAAGLVLVRRRGRERFNHLNPAPLQEIRERWLTTFSEQSARSDLALKAFLEQSSRERETSMTAVRVESESELRIQAPPERVFAALTTEQHRWYPYTYGGERVHDIVFEPRIGGAVYEDWGDGAGHFYGTVMHYDPPHQVVIRGGLPGSTVLENAFVLTSDPSGSGATTVVRHRMTAFGDFTDDEVAGIGSHGNMSLFEPQLRAWVERGEPVR